MIDEKSLVERYGPEIANTDSLVLGQVVIQLQHDNQRVEVTKLEISTALQGRILVEASQRTEDSNVVQALQDILQNLEEGYGNSRQDQS